jgi:hypothetical protein
VPFPGSGSICARDADCPAGERCSVFQGPDGFEGLCREPAGAGELGDACATANDCAGSFCYEAPAGAYCTALCSRHADCGSGFLCQRYTFPDGSHQGLCARIDGSAAPCAHDGECPPGETCQHFQHLDSVAAYCLAPPGDGGQGQVCQQAEQCRSRVCDPVRGCLQLCTGDAHCPADAICLAFRYPDQPGLYQACHPFPGSRCPCGRDADCAAGEACAAAPRLVAGAEVFDFLCRTRIDQGLDAGAGCSAAARCYNDMCLAAGAPDWCTAACSGDADCPIGSYCSGWRSDGIEPLLAGTCWALPGSRAPCNRDADCTHAGEHCTAYKPLDADVAGRCTTPIAGGAEPGQPCQSDADCASRFCDETHELCATYCSPDDDSCQPW